jgi:transposase
MIKPIPTDLPDDTEALRALIGELVRDIAQYQQRIDYLTRRLFGKKSEKFDPKDLDFFGRPDLLSPNCEPSDETLDKEEPQPQDEPKVTPSPKRKNRGRKPLPKDLPRERREYDVPESEKVCPDCQSEKTCIGEDTTEQLEYVPASLFVVEHVQLKYACRRCEGHVTQAEKPAQPIEKGLAGPGLLAHVITSKYCDHLPLYRQESILARHGVDLSRSTLCDWMMESAALLEPPVCLGRKNWLFAGSERGGHAAAVLFSLIESAKRHGLDPFCYLRDLLALVPVISHKRLHLLFPNNWKSVDPETLI